MRKFVKWLHKDQKIYIENLVSKLGIHNSHTKNHKHKRVSSCCSNSHFESVQHNLYKEKDVNYESFAESRVPSMNSITASRQVRNIFSPENYRSRPKLLAHNQENINP